ncbi:MAG TPA: VOC family protein [Bryobacteraceae bacterium]|jgi:catechol 2,3-dioxygenase-like lactoylglutathione lyase family enzyme
MIWKLILGVSVAAGAFAQNRLVSNVGNFIHDVGDLDRSAHFYRDVLGMEMPRPPGDWQSTEGVLKMYDAAGGKFRVANAQIPGSPMRVEMVEFQGVDRKPARRPWGAVGNSVLMLTVADLTPVQERLKSANAPMLVQAKKACDGRGLVTADPDGFAVMVTERSEEGKAPSQAKSNFTGMRFGYLVSGDALAKGPLAALGLAAETRTHPCRSIEETLLNSAGPASVATVPGGFEIWLAKGKVEKTKPPVRPHDPGAAVLRLMVSDVDAAAQALRQAQAQVVSEGGAIQTLPPGGLRAVILRAPDDLFIQVVK